MNIFYLDINPFTAAKYHGDRHVCKMILESAQMLSAAHHVLSPENDNSHLYKPTHTNHPCSLWVRKNSANYEWTWELLEALCYEFRIRRGKKHATERLLPPLSTLPYIPIATQHTLPALAMPDEFKSDDPVTAYRRYYRQKFREGVVCYNWSDERSEPSWLKY